MWAPCLDTKRWWAGSDLGVVGTIGDPRGDIHEYYCKTFVGTCRLSAKLLFWKAIIIHVRTCSICLLRSTGALARHHVGFQSIPNVTDWLVRALAASHCVAFARALVLLAAYNMPLTVPEKPGRVLVHNVLYASFPPANVAQHTDSLWQSCIL